MHGRFVIILARVAAQVPVAAVPGAAPFDLEGARGGAGRVGVGRCAVIIRVVPIKDPLIDVAGHVQHAVEAGAVRVNPNGRMLGVAVILSGDGMRCAAVGRVTEVGFVARDGGVAPWVGAPVGPPGGFFPFRFRGQASPRPRTEGLGIVPADVHHRVIFPA